MGCDVALPYGMPVGPVRALFEERDARFSRFRESSELNRVNECPLGLTPVSEEFASMLDLSLDAARATDGLVSPAVGGALLAAGYDRDFSRLPLDVGAVEPAGVPSWTTLSLHGAGLLRSEPLVLDLNGVVKGRTVDDALALAGRGWVSAGGDVATFEPLVVGLPGGDTVTLHGGGLATSSVAKRRWLADGRPQNHLIDPRTARPTTSPWRDVSVAAGSCYVADVAAKAALLLGDDGPAWLEERRLAGRFVDHDGRVVLTDAWARRAPRPLAA
ncbi:MAG TPA: FAD:protein FMN transferase [Gaiellaceae bacterium]|jgi:thiamine biosynthesis lipoprotein|nr:FAD:protein FMN transferase [Gaiellaceae bacterium]